MGRIRTIKPEFPQSESMGRVSRESRLCFILLFTLADDAGRLRGNSRMLASLLYPYDDDAKKYIDSWLSELHKEQCITRYEADGDCFIQLNKWLQHQKIDKPTPSKIPEFDSDSLPFANPREDSVKNAADRKGMEGNGGDQGKDRTARGSRLPTNFEPDFQFAVDQGLSNTLEEASKFRDYWNSQAGQKGVKLDWQATWRNWCRNAKKPTRQHSPETFKERDSRIARERYEELTGKRRTIDVTSSFLEIENGATN